MVTAVTAALSVLGFMELSEEDVPPEEIWHHEALMTEWFDEVKARRKAGSGASHDEEVPLTDNEHAEDYR